MVVISLLTLDYGQVEYIARLVEEEELEEIDKKEGVKGMVEGFMPVSYKHRTEHPIFCKMADLCHRKTC